MHTPLLRDLPPAAPRAVTDFEAGLETLTQATQVTAEQKDTLTSLEQLLKTLAATMENNPPADIEQFAQLIQQPQFAHFGELVKNLASNPFSTIRCR